MQPNPAERYLDADAGTVPELGRGPDGTVYHLKRMKKYLVMRSTGTETWCNRLEMAMHLVDRANNPPLRCRCVRCRKRIVKPKKLK